MSSCRKREPLSVKNGSEDSEGWSFFRGERGKGERHPFRLTNAQNDAKRGRKERRLIRREGGE